MIPFCVFSTPAVEKLVHRMLNRYAATQPLVAQMESTELRPSDGYIILASHLLWDRWIATNETRS